MAWVRLYITVEGQAERRFAEDALGPHLASFEIEVKSRVVVTNRKLGKRGGIFNFEIIHQDIIRLMKEDGDPDARFSTMIDLYALPREFPGWVDANKRTRPAERVAVLENAFEKAMGDSRFIPYIQLHEFEALLYCDLSELQRRISGSEVGLRALAKEVLNIAPEDINEGAATAPSKRLINHIPLYDRQKVRVGGPAASAIGLARLRARCPHFHAWLEKMEAL